MAFCSFIPFKEFSADYKRLKNYYKIDNLYLWFYKNTWWLMLDHNIIYHNIIFNPGVVYEVPQDIILKLKELNKIVPELSDEEYKIQYALGTIEGKWFKIND